MLDNTTYKLFMGLDGENLKQAKALWDFTEKESQIAFSKIRRSRSFFLGYRKNVFESIRNGSRSKGFRQRWWQLDWN